MKTRLLSISLLTLGISPLVQAEEAIQKSISTGIFYAHGQSTTVNTADSKTTSVPLMVNLKKDKLAMSLSTAYVSMEAGDTKATGLSDTTLSLGYDITEMPWWTVKLKHKFATGSADDGLSTGKEDTALQLESFYPLNSTMSLFTTLGYKWVGKVTGLSMKDTTFASIGGGYSYSSTTNFGASFDYNQSVFTTLEDQVGASVFASKKLNNTFNISAFISYDNTKTTSAGSTISAKF